MKAVAAILLLAASANAISIAQKQQYINHLLDHVTEPIPSEHGAIYGWSQTYKPSEHPENYKDGGKAVESLKHEIDDHLVLEKHNWFSLFNTRQREEALALYHVFDNCNDFEVFAETAAHYRDEINEGEFIYAVYAYITHSSDASGVDLPPLYEVTPHLFTNSEVIRKAYTAKMTQVGGTFHSTFTGSEKNPEQRVAYFGEDVGMNSHHVNWHLNFPFWWDGEKIDRKGELFYYAHHQLTARFDAERLSNHLPVVDELYWDKPIFEGFAPHTSYRYGGEFPSRPDNKVFDDVEGIVRVRDVKLMESRIRDAIAHGYFVDASGKHVDISNDHGIDVLGDAIESSTSSPNAQYYGALHNYAHILLGEQADPKGKFKLPPGVMEHFETATRDPAFFRLHKYMNSIFKEHKDSLTPYTPEELSYDNAEITSIAIEGNLQTYFEDYEVDLNQALPHIEGIPDVDVKAVFRRMNHKPFSYDINVNAKNAETATVRIFLCPKHDYNGIEMQLDEARWGCIEVDKFWHKLVAGANHIQRKASESSVTIGDMHHFEELIKKADEAIATGVDYDLEHISNCGIPNRLLIPKGNTEGMEFEYFVAVTSGADSVHGDAEHIAHNHVFCGSHGIQYPDKRPMGYPFDRHVHDSRNFDVPNFKWETVTVYHKK